MKALTACRRMLLIAAILSCSHPAVAQYTPGDLQRIPEGAPYVSGDMTLKQFSAALHQISSHALMSQGSKAEALSSMPSIILADRTLAKYPSIRTNAAAIFTNIQTLRSLNAQFQKEMQTQRTKPKTVTSGGYIDPRKPPKPVVPWEDQEKISKPFREKHTAIGAEIKKRLESIDREIEVLTEKQITLPAGSPLVAALTKSNPFAVKPGINQRFEIVSSIDGGFLAYLQKTGPADPNTKELTFATDRSKTVFVRGYNKPVRLGELVRIRVTPGQMVTIQGMPVQEYIALE